MAVCSVFNWVANFFVSYYFLQLVDAGVKNDTFNVCGRGVVRLQEVIDLAGRPVAVKPGAPVVRYEIGLDKIGRHVTLPDTRASVAAFDLTFSAPKSTSVVFALGGPDVARAVADLHGQAVAGSLSYLERHGISAVRRSGPARLVVPTTGAVAAVSGKSRGT